MLLHIFFKQENDFIMLKYFVLNALLGGWYVALSLRGSTLGGSCDRGGLAVEGSLASFPCPVLSPA